MEERKNKVESEMKKTWELIKHRIPTKRLWQHIQKNQKHSFANWIFEELFQRKK